MKNDPVSDFALRFGMVMGGLERSEIRNYLLSSPLVDEEKLEALMEAMKVVSMAFYQE